MGFFRHKHRKRRLRWRRLFLPYVAAACITTVVIAVYSVDTPQDQAVYEPVGGSKSVSSELQSLEKDNSQYVVMKKNLYVCGEESIDLGKLEGHEIYDLLNANQHWSLTWTKERTAMLTEEIADLSPDCRDNAYFGLDEDGNLTLFEGMPSDKKVLRTFFQIDIKHLESSLPREAVKQLRDGIRITDYSGYNSVLSTFADYAVETQIN